jgi:hypothetical protein
MPSAPYEHRFAESEATSILKRAADLQREADDLRRMSGAELEDAAASAGIAAIHVRRATAEHQLQLARRDRASPALGGPRTILLEITLDGEIPVPAYEHVIEALRRHTGELGVASLIGRSLTWTALPGHGHAGPGWSRTIAMTIVPRAGRTRIRIEEKLDHLVRRVFMTSLLSVGGPAAALPILALALVGLPALIPVGVGLWFGGAWAIARRVYQARVATRERELHAGLHAITEIAEDYERS